MIGVAPEIIPTRRYTISEVCSMLGIHRNSLRRYTNDGDIKCIFRKAGSRMKPLYEGKEILKFWRAAI